MTFDIVNLDVRAGCKYRLLLRFSATSILIDPFLALVPKFLSADTVAVEWLNMDIYASMSAWGGTSLCNRSALTLAGQGQLHGSYRRPILVTVPSVQSVLPSQVDDFLDFRKLDTCHCMIRVEIPIREAEQYSARIVKVILGQELLSFLLAVDILNEVIRVEGRTAYAVGEFTGTRHEENEDGNSYDKERQELMSVELRDRHECKRR